MKVLFGITALGAATLLGACGDDGGAAGEDDGNNAGNGNGGDAGNGNAGNGSGGNGTGGNGNGGSGSGGRGGTGSGPDGGSGGACASTNAQTQLQPAYLAFAFDASASMGSNIEIYFDKTKKWDPVKAAATQFFSDPASRGFSASLTAFPTTSARTYCQSSSYVTPNVPMTALPSGAFATQLNLIEPTLGDRRATPTLAAIQGVISYVQAQRRARAGRYAIVFVSDGNPQICSDEGNITPSVNAVAAARADGISTYVIGVKNPSPGPDVVSNLTDIAEAGGTTRAFIIDTNAGAGATTTAFRNAVNQIRASQVACNLAIPAPPDGRTFDKSKVVVKYTRGTAAPTTLTYDQACTRANAWRYDNPTTPKQIQLCPTTCTTVQADPTGKISVEFTCERQIEIPE